MIVSMNVENLHWPVDFIQSSIFWGDVIFHLIMP